MWQRSPGREAQVSQLRAEKGFGAPCLAWSQGLIPEQWRVSARGGFLVFLFRKGTGGSQVGLAGDEARPGIAGRRPVLQVGRETTRAWPEQPQQGRTGVRGGAWLTPRPCQL